MAQLTTLAPWRMVIRGLTVGGQGNTYRFATTPEGIGMPDVESSFTPFSGADGGYLQGDSHTERVLQGQILVYPEVRTGDATWRAVETLKAAFSRAASDIPIELRVGEGRPVRVYGRPDRCEVLEYDANFGRAVVAWRIRCGNAFLHGDPARVSFEPASGTAFDGRTYPRVYPRTYGTEDPTSASGRLTLVNEGNYRVPWVAEFVGPVTAPQLTHLASGRSIRWNGDVLEGQRLVIDAGTKVVTLDGAPAFYLLGGVPDWWLLDPGQNEVLYTAATGDGPCEFTYTPAWL